MNELVSNVIRHEDARMINVEVAVESAGAVTVTVTGGAGSRPRCWNVRPDRRRRPA